MTATLASSTRHCCEVPTTCQPPSAWSKDPWPAVIREICTDGLSLTLERRFERGSGLAIELPTEDGSTSTILARVVQVSPFSGGGYLLGCTFISHLSEEEVQHVLGLDPVLQASLAETNGSMHGGAHAISGVLFQAKVRKGEVIRWFVKRLDFAGTWPLRRDRTVSLQIGGITSSAPTPPLEMTVRSCRLFGSYWIVNCKLVTLPSPEVLEALSCPANPT